MMTGVGRPLRGLVRLAAIAPVLVSLTIVGAATKLGPAVAGCAQAATAHHAALVIEHSDGSGHGAGPVITVCVPFTEDSLTGDALLARSGIEYAAGDSGQAVCQIDSEPATGTYQPQCLSSSKPYWAMFVSRGGGSWTYSSLGFSAQTFRDGDAEGFRYEGQNDGTAPPSPGGVCRASTTAVPVPAKSMTPVPRTSAGPTGAAAPATSASARSALTSPAGAAPSSSPLPSTTATAHPAAAIVSTNRPAPLRGVSAGAWIAGAFAGLLTLGLGLQLVRARRRTPQRPPP